MSTTLAAKCPRHWRPDAHSTGGQVSTTGHTGPVSEQRRCFVRHAEQLVGEALADTRVVTINGARQAGKSTLARLVAGGTAGSVVRFLDDPATLRAAQED